MVNDSPMTMDEFAARMQAVPGGENLLARLAARTFEDFVTILYADLDDIIKLMESNPQRHQPDDEDKLTYFVASMLRQRQYRARQGEVRGGSVDLTVEGHKDAFVWTSEAKIFYSLPAVREGFLQLHTRYSPADLEHHKTGLLIYIKREGSADLMKTWRDELGAMSLKDLRTDDCPTRPKLAFLSEHKSRRSGLSAVTRHMSVSVFQDPEDKSGRTAKKHVVARAAATAGVEDDQLDGA